MNNELNKTAQEIALGMAERIFVKAHATSWKEAATDVSRNVLILEAELKRIEAWTSKLDQLDEVIDKKSKCSKVLGASIEARVASDKALEKTRAVLKMVKNLEAQALELAA